jgi:hypothetical protein
MEAWDRSANSPSNSGSLRCRHAQDTGPQRQSSLRYCYSARSSHPSSCFTRFGRSTTNRRYDETSFDLRSNITNKVPVLETVDDIHILRAPVARPHFPCLLPSAILSAARTRLWTFARNIFLASAICHYIAASIELPYDIYSVPWLITVEHFSLHMVAQES